MFVSISKERFLDARHRFYEWRYELDFARKTLLALWFACLTGLAAFVRVPVPFSPVPFTGQVFIVLLSGMVLGHLWGGLAQVMYLGIGLAGVPWFTGGVGGISVVYGPTIGYLLGFVAAALLIGWLVDRKVEYRKVKFQVPIMLVAVLTIYAFGVPILALNAGVDLWTAVLWGAAPFILVDILKLILAVFTGKVIMTKQPFGQY